MSSWVNPTLLLSASCISAGLLDKQPEAETAPPGPGSYLICADRTAAIEHLQKTYGETRKGAGLASDGTVYELFVGRETWTIMKSLPNGLTCMVGNGAGWRTAGERGI